MTSRQAEAQRRGATAHHEAGHAVVAILEEQEFEYVTIVPDDAAGSLGHLRDSVDPEFAPDCRVCGLDVFKIIGRIRVRLAGRFAEERFTGKPEPDGARIDRDYAWELAGYYCGSDRELKAFMRWLAISTEEAVNTPRNWQAIQSVACALLKQQRLTQGEVREIYRRRVLGEGNGRSRKTSASASG
jgi:ATP-dependent Zn protease